MDLLGLSDLVAGRGSEPTAAADPSWGGLGGANLYSHDSVNLTRHAYARYASDRCATAVAAGPSQAESLSV